MIANRRKLLLGGGAAYAAPVDYYNGTYSGARTSGVAGWLFIDLDLAVAARAKISSLFLYEVIACNYALFIMRRDSTSVFTCMKRLDVVSGTSGWQAFALPAAYIVPSDAYTYHIGVGSRDTYSPLLISAGGHNRAYLSSLPAEGAQNTYTVNADVQLPMGYRGQLHL